MSTIRRPGPRGLRVTLVVAALVASPLVGAACGDDREDEPPPTLGGATVLEQTSTSDTTAPSG